MASDRFVYWKKGNTPSLQEILYVLEDFLGGVGEIHERDIKGKGTWLLVSLPGKPTNPFSRVANREFFEVDARGFEVVNVESSNMDVITRRADHFTGCLATEFAKLCARYWDAQYSDSEETIEYSLSQLEYQFGFSQPEAVVNFLQKNPGVEEVLLSVPNALRPLCKEASFRIRIHTEDGSGDFYVVMETGLGYEQRKPLKEKVYPVWDSLVPDDMPLNLVLRR